MSDDLEQRAALVEAIGIDPSSPHGEALAALHEGELTVTAVAESAETFGLLDEGPAPADEGELTEEQRQAIASSERGQQLAAGAAPVEPRTLDQEIGDAERYGQLTGRWEQFDRLQAVATEQRSRR